MKIISRASVIFSLRSFAAAVLAMYIAYELDLSRPTWAFITTYVVSGPLLGMGRSKTVYRILGTLCGAVFCVATLPNLVDAPELFALTIACWIGGCLYLSIIDGTPRAYAFMLAGYTAALIGFPSVNVPETIFDTALARTEEIGIALFCVHVMSYLPFNKRASDALMAGIDQWLSQARGWAFEILTSPPDKMLMTDHSRLMIEASELDSLRIYAHYDTPHFKDIEGWVIRLQRHIHDFFADLVTLEAQMKGLKATNQQALLHLRPVTDAIIAWFNSGKAELPYDIWHLPDIAMDDADKRDLITSGVLGTLFDLVKRRSECMELRTKIAAGAKAEKGDVPLKRYVDYRQSFLYAVSVAGAVMAMCAFWILSGWPEGTTATLLTAVICCFFASLEAPPKIASMVMVLFCSGAAIGWGYNFVLFPHIDGFPLLVGAMALSCIPIGMLMNNPALTGAMVAVVFGINIASFNNRYSIDITGFMNTFISEVIGVAMAGFALTLIRNLSLRGATERLLNANGKALALLATDDTIGSDVFERMEYSAGMAFARASALKKTKDIVFKRVLLDLQTGRALIQIRALLPKISPDLLPSLRAIENKIALHFSRRQGLHEPVPLVCNDIRNLTQNIESRASSYEALSLVGLMETLNRGLAREVL